MSKETLYLNGAFMPLAEGRISVQDRGFQLGDGVYEVIKVMNRRLLFLDDHLERLRVSLEQILLPNALEGHSLEAVLPQLVTRSGVQEGIVYLQVTRGPAPREFAFPLEVRPTVIAYAAPREFPDPATIRNGIGLHPVKDIRWGRCDLKATGLLASVLAKEEARRAGAEEALYVGPEGVVREGSSSNVFVFLDGVLRTHPADGRILPGITRHHVLSLAAGMNFQVREEAVRLEELEAAEEVFIASTIRDILPVVGVDGRAVRDGRPGPNTLRLLDALRTELASAAGSPPLLPLA